jgi:hypothetical protein
MSRMSWKDPSGEFRDKVIFASICIISLALIAYGFLGLLSSRITVSDRKISTSRNELVESDARLFGGFMLGVGILGLGGGILCFRQSR